jgi:tRNA (guanine-N7-)-methyltransferase
MNSDEPSKRGVRSYVLRTGRMTDSQKRAFDDHWSQFGLLTTAGRLDCQDVFARQAPLVVEVGFGMGESLLTMAQQEPDKNFVGIEVHTPGVGRLLNNLAENKVENVRLYQDDAQVVLDHCIADNSVYRLQLYFPDPWPKKKHHKRRIVQQEFVEKVWRKLIQGGAFHIATDWQAYAEHMLEVFARCPELFRNQAGPGQFSPRPDYRPTTKFEQRGQRLGHGVWDLLFEKIT